MAPTGAARGLGPHPHLRNLRVGGNRADEMLSSLTPPPAGPGGGGTGDRRRQALFLTLPATPKSVGKGSHLLCFRAGLRESKSLAQSK